MTMKAPVSTGGDFTPAPSGAHPAVLIQLIDLGTADAGYFTRFAWATKVLYNKRVQVLL